jgi:hypothetical protein
LHAQSYWVAFEHDSVINSAEFGRWWAGLVPISDRTEVINRYEIGMSARFESVGVPVTGAFEPTYEQLLVATCRAVDINIFKMSGVTRYIRLDLEIARTLNPTLFLWDHVLEEFSILKRSLLIRPDVPLNLTPLYARAHASPMLRELIEDSLRS